MERRDFAIIRLLFDLALRREEVTSLDYSHVNYAERSLMVMGKGASERMPIQVTEPTWEALSAWIEARGRHSGPLFLNFDRARKGDGRLSGRSVDRITKKLGKDK